MASRTHVTIRLRPLDADRIEAIQARFPDLDRTGALRFALSVATVPPSWWQLRRRRLARRLARLALTVGGSPEPRPERKRRQPTPKRTVTP